MNDRAAQFLLQTQNSDGGWGYRVHGMSYVEPTAVVLLALRNSGETNARNRGRDFLLLLQHSDGGWGIAAMDSESGWMTAWALIALADFTQARDAVTLGAAWLVNTVGFRVTDPESRQRIREVFQIDSALRGWPWQAGDAAWVHPTALALLALEAVGVSLSNHQGKLPPDSIKFILNQAQGRVRDGIDYLFDRAVSSGGWNIGNPWMIDKKIPATIQDTAVVLIAIRAMDIVDKTQVPNGIQFLREAVSRAKTAAELAWGIYALKSWNAEIGDGLVRLNALQSTDGSWSGNPLITAIAILSQS